MPRILFCSNALTFGGEQKQLALVLGHLNRERFQPALCSIRPYGYLDKAIEQLDVPLSCLGIRNKYDLVRSVRRLFRIIHELHIDLMHIGIFNPQFPALIAAMSAGIPTVAVLESTYDITTRSRFGGNANTIWQYKWRMLYMAFALLARTAHVEFVALSEEVKRSAIRHLHLPPPKITVIPIGIAPQDYDPASLSFETCEKTRRDLGLDASYPVLLNVARLVPLKGQEDLLNAMPLVLDKFPRAKLLIAGDGPLLAHLSAVRDRLGLQKHVLLLGRRDDIPALLSTSDLFVFASHYEGLPGAVVEAMSAGKPVVACDIASLSEVVRQGETGILVNGRDIGGFAQAIMRLAEDPAGARAMGERGRLVIRQKYDITQNMRDLEDVYHRMLTVH